MGAAVDSYRFTVAGLTTVAEDTFTRADSSTLGNTEVGSFAWTEHAGNVEIVSNAVEAVYSNFVDNVATFDSGVADCTITANVRTASAADRTTLAVVCRYVDASNFWWVEVNDFSGDSRLTLRKCVAGAYTYADTYAAGFVENGTHEIIVEASGSSWTVQLDGVQRLSATDSAHSTATKHGVRIYTASTYDGGTSGLLDIKVEA